FLSTSDAQLAEKQLLAARTLVIPPVFFDPLAKDTTRANSPFVDSPFIEAAFLGNYHWWPNARGLQWFLTQVFPSVPGRVRLHLFGLGMERIGSDDPHIVVHGQFPHLDDVW